MPKYANANNAYVISDRSGFRYRFKDTKKEWNGLLVGKDEYEDKHPQLDPKHNTTDAEAIRDARPERSEPSIEVLLELNPFQTGSSGSSTITVTERSHGRLASSTVRFRNVSPFDGITTSVMQNSSGYSIVSVVDADSYTVSVSDTATVGSVKGGGKIASAGPVTLES
jgi:hypothetical protein